MTKNKINKMDKYQLYNGYLDENMKNIIEHGFKHNLEFLYEINNMMNKILISKNNLIRSSMKTFYDFNYPSYKTCKKLIENNKYENVDFVIVLFDWYNLYNKKIMLSNEAHTLAVYLQREKYIDKTLFIENKNEFFNILDTENIDLIDYDDEHQESYMKKTYEFNNYDYIDRIDIYKVNYSKYEIINSFDKAYRLYKNGEKNNEILSKLFSEDVYNYEKYIKETEFFLIFARHDIDCKYVNKWTKFKYNILYINILFPNSTQYYEKYIDIPEYNLYVAAVKMNNEKIVEKLLKLYKKHGKFYKKLDLENQMFINEEINEIPEVKPLNLITGDILNPYYELKPNK